MSIISIFQSREARKYEQQNNPHYLKGDLEYKNGRNEENVESIPIAEIDLNVPLRVMGYKRSDKYLNMSSEKKKHKKKSKKKKHKSER